ncbi:hypothetical protein FOA52_010047 [Chlamydomonas sp. UWO 241]|nr:hypothetical protein FOA52_010047 [Chlamydomonas sp. UWO 241]
MQHGAVAGPGPASPSQEGVPPQSGGAESKGRRQQSSNYRGVSWHKAKSAWKAELWDAQTKCERFIGNFASEEGAVRAYDFAAVQVHGPGAKRNFPGEDISELAGTADEGRKKQRGMPARSSAMSGKMATSLSGHAAPARRAFTSWLTRWIGLQTRCKQGGAKGQVSRR